MYNPLHIAGARGRAHGQHRQRHRVGVELKNCPDGSIKPSWQDCPPVGSVPFGGWPGGWPTPLTPSGGGGSGGNTPPTGTSGGGMPPTPTYTPPTPTYTPPGPTPTPTPTPTPSGGGCSAGGGCGCAPVAQVCPENQKRYNMPFIPDAGFTTAVTAGSTAQFVGRPQKLFKADRLIIPSTIAPFFDVVNFIIANIPQSLTQGNLPADMFSEVSTYTLMSFDQAYPGIDIVLVVKNKSSVTQTFQAALVGEAVG